MIKKLPYKIFLQTFKYVPRLAVSLVVVNKEGEVLWAQRSIPPLKGYWHLPGSFVLKGESLESCVKRIVKNELNFILPKKQFKLIGVFNDIGNDPRGHVVDVVYEIPVDKDFKILRSRENKVLNFYKHLPKKVGFKHNLIVKSYYYQL